MNSKEIAFLNAFRYVNTSFTNISYTFSVYCCSHIERHSLQVKHSFMERNKKEMNQGFEMAKLCINETVEHLGLLKSSFDLLKVAISKAPEECFHSCYELLR